MYCHDLEVMSSNPSRVILGVLWYFCPKSYLSQKTIIQVKAWSCVRLSMDASTLLTLMAVVTHFFDYFFQCFDALDERL